MDEKVAFEIHWPPFKFLSDSLVCPHHSLLLSGQNISRNSGYFLSCIYKQVIFYLCYSVRLGNFAYSCKKAVFRLYYDLSITFKVRI